MMVCERELMLLSEFYLCCVILFLLLCVLISCDFGRHRLPYFVDQGASNSNDKPLYQVSWVASKTAGDWDAILRHQSTRLLMNVLRTEGREKFFLQLCLLFFFPSLFLLLNFVCLVVCFLFRFVSYCRSVLCPVSSPGVPHRLSQALCQSLNLTEVTLATLTRAQREAMVRTLTAYTLPVTASKGIQDVGN
jgi:hypothetical protein